MCSKCVPLSNNPFDLETSVLLLTDGLSWEQIIKINFVCFFIQFHKIIMYRNQPPSSTIKRDGKRKYRNLEIYIKNEMGFSKSNFHPFLVALTSPEFPVDFIIKRCLAYPLIRNPQPSTGESFS